MFLLRYKLKFAGMNNKDFTILLLLKATPQWLSLSRTERTAFFNDRVAPLFQKVGKTVHAHFFDSEYFHARISDFMVITTSELKDYQYLIEMLRDTAVYSVPYFEVVDIVVGQENLFREMEERMQSGN